MNLKGINIKGLSFFPASEKVIKPSKHKYGAVSTWTQNTDQIKADYAGKEILGFKYNFNQTAFISPFTSIVDIDEIAKTGKIQFGIYFQTEFWQNPVTLNYEQIPDFTATTWTQNAVDAGLIPADRVGTTKTANYPQHGQQLFDLTNGKYGYDFVNGVAGEIDVLSPLIEYYHEWFKDKFGRYPSVASLGYGRVTPLYAMENYFLGVRNSAYDYGYDYHLTKSEANGKPESTRQNDMGTELGKTRDEVHQIAADTLANAIANNGWYSDFTHWHVSYDTEIAEFYESQRTVIGTQDVVSLDYGTAIEYNFLRNMVRRISIHTVDNELSLIVDIKDYEGLPLDRIYTTLSVDVDLTGTILEGKEIEGMGSAGIRKLGTNQFIVEVPYNQKDGFYTVRLKETLTPNYLDFSLPTINSVTKNGDILTVTTDKETKVVVYTVPLGTDLYNSSAIARTSEFNTTHEINVTGIDFTTVDVYVGVITKERQSSLSIKYNF